jgi:SAM-dependent methyltransferase
MDELRVAAEIIEHYQQGRPEDDRLRRGAGRVELLRTQELIRRHLPGTGLRILDVGGASGAHAEWLAADGHHVHVVDPVSLHVEQATELGQRPGAPFTAELGDARRLPQADASVDVVLLLGPLYHLVERADRLAALAEGRRVVRPGGLVFAAAISRFASLYDGLSRDLLADPGFRQVVDDDLGSGRHRNPAGHPDWFTTAYFHRPDEVPAEATDAGLAVVGLFGIEGISAWLLRPEPGSGRDGEPGRGGGSADEELAGEELARHLEAARLVEQESAVLGVSPHLLLVARREPA